MYRGISGDRQSSLADQTSVSSHRLLHGGYHSDSINNTTSENADHFVAKPNTLGLAHPDSRSRDADDMHSVSTYNLKIKGGSVK